MLLSSISLIISLATSLLVQDPIAAGAFWLSIIIAVPGVIAVLLGVRTNPGRDTILLLITGLLLVLFSAYADLSIWIATNLAQAKCEPYPGTITCQLPDFSYLIALTLLWTIPGVLAVINSSVYLQKTRAEKARFLETRRKAAEKDQAKQNITRDFLIYFRKSGASRLGMRVDGCLDFDDYRVSRHVAKALSVWSYGDQDESDYVEEGKFVDDAQEAAYEGSSHVNGRAGPFVNDLDASDLFAEGLA